MWVNWLGESVIDGVQYIGKDGTQYPGNFPKEQISELMLILEVAQPAITQYQSAISGVEQIDGQWTQIWAVRDWSAEEIAEHFTTTKAAKFSEINEEFSIRMSALVSGYSDREQQTWFKQESEARAFIFDPLSQTTFIDALCAQSGADKSEQVKKIIAKSDALAFYSGRLIGNLKRLESMLSACKTIDEIDMIDSSDSWEN